MSKYNLFATSALVAVGLLTGGHAVAAEAAAATDANSTATTIGEIVVTAEKREQNLQTVPVAISAYTSKQRDVVGINTIQDITNFTPGLNYSTSLDRAFIRGIGRETNNLDTDAGVATYVDGFYNTATNSAAGDSLFIQRIEVLRGPQGTLYGRNSIGGAINVISFRPTKDFYAEGRLGYGNYDGYKVEAATSGPITDHFRFRVGAYEIGQGRGYFKNVADGSTLGARDETRAIEVQFEGDAGPVDAWVKFSDVSFHGQDLLSNSIGPYDYSKYNSVAALVVNPAYGFTLPGFTQIGSATQNPGMTDIRNVSTDNGNHARNTDDYNVTAQLTWHLGVADVKYIGGYTHYHYHFTDDGDFLGLGVGTSITRFTLPTGLTIFPASENYYDEVKSYYSNEIDITSTTPGPFQWIVGGYQYQEHYFQDYNFAEPQQAQLGSPLFPTGAPAPLNPSRDYIYTNQTITATSYAAFGQVDWKFADNFKTTVGLRYTRDHKAGFEHARILCFDGIFCPLDSIYGPFTPAIDITSGFIAGAVPPGAPGVISPATIDPVTGVAVRQVGATWSAVTGTAGIEWTPDRDTLVYGKYARGYKAGGFATGGFAPFPESQSEHVDAFEVGAKKEFGRRLQANLSGFYYEYHDKQDPVTIQPASGPAFTQLVNLDKVRLYGVELETIWQPIDNLQILLNYSHLSSKITSAGGCFVDTNDRFAQQPGVNVVGCLTAPPGTSQPQNVTGAAAPQSTPNKVTLNGNYTFHLESGALTFSATYIWKDATYDSIFNRSYNLAPAYDQVDLRASFTDIKNRFTLIVFAKNVFNKIGYDNASGFATAQFSPLQPVTIAQIYGLTPPRTYGAELQFRFR
ncbi:MAG: TonB-dependent receptor [Caulobacteraceae bacterium]|nr:TonB-dependent receptor [Caulobacteraceae bacterium]